MTRSGKWSSIFPLLAFLLLETGAAVPAWAGITYTCDPTIDAAHAGTCAYLNSTIAGLYGSTFSNANASIYIQLGNTDLGVNIHSLAVVSYSDYLTAFTANATASGNTIQADALKALNTFDAPLYGAGNVEIPVALAVALGFTGSSGLMSDGMTFCQPLGTSTCFDGVITVTNEPGVLYYREGNEGPNQWDFYSTTEHETDEILGTGSCISTGGQSLSDFCGNNIPSAVDLYRYQSAGNLVLISTTPGAYFSYNGGQTNGAHGNVYNTLDNGDDYGDFVSSCSAPPSVQDAEACAGHDQGVDITNDGGAEINILNAVGYAVKTPPANPPLISNALNGATAQATMAASTYVAIYGTNLSTNSAGRTWTAADFTANPDGTLNMPTALDGTSVMVNSVPAYVEYISPTQLNIITPAIAATGNGIPVVVSLNGQQSTAFAVTLLNLAPSFFAWDPGTADNGKYLIAQHLNYTNVGKVGLFPTAPANFTTPAKPGETIQLYGTGFGPASPPIAPGIETDKVYNLSPTPTATVGGIPAQVSFAGLIPPESQVYQFDVEIPSNAPNGDLPLVVNVNGTLSYSGLITVQN
jgi:uncharacterized protein (TIGR03437 family)